MSKQLISFPKSGRTWLRFMLRQLGYDRGIRFHHDGFEYNDGTRPPLDFDIASRLEKYSDADEIVYLERDPRDVIVSLYYQVTGRFRDFFGYGDTLSAFIRDDYFGAPNLHRFRSMWDELLSRRSFLRVSYEDCHADPERTLARVLDYYGLPASAGDIASAVERSSFDRMRSLEASETFEHAWLRPRNGFPKVREGRVGAYRDLLGPADIAFLDSIFSPD